MFDISALAVPEAKTETRDYTDPAQPGQTFTLTLNTAPDMADQLAVSDLAQQITKKYVTGGKDKTGRFVPAALFPPIGEKPVRITALLCGAIAALMTFQVDEKPLSFQQWVKFAVCAPTAFEEMVTWAGECMSHDAPDDEEIADPNV